MMGRTTKTEDARTRKARQEVRDAEAAEAEAEAEDFIDAEAEDAGMAPAPVGRCRLTLSNPC